MAKSARYRWQGFGSQATGPDPEKKKRHKPAGITNKQAKFLAALQSAEGEKYTGNGMSRRQAQIEISRLVDARKKRTSATWRRLEREFDRRIERDE